MTPFFFGGGCHRNMGTTLKARMGERMPRRILSWVIPQTALRVRWTPALWSHFLKSTQNLCFSLFAWRIQQRKEMTNHYQYSCFFPFHALHPGVFFGSTFFFFFHVFIFFPPLFLWWVASMFAICFALRLPCTGVLCACCGDCVGLWPVLSCTLDSALLDLGLLFLICCFHAPPFFFARFSTTAPTAVALLGGAWVSRRRAVHCSALMCAFCWLSRSPC